MRTDFFKPLGDVAKESLEHLNDNDRLLKRQCQVSAVLSDCPPRSGCIICGNTLNDAPLFKHRLVDYVLCPVCEHIQSKVQPPSGYPTREIDGLTFDQIYPKLSKEEYMSRKNRIYRPKLDWLLSCHKELGLNRENLIAARWLELGCSCGYFLDALRDVGVKNFRGLEENKDLVKRANTVLGDDCVQSFRGSLASAILEYPADIYVAFFVLEHMEDTGRFFQAMRRCPKGTLFYFSVPVFGFATFLESGFGHYFARNLDSVLHTQLYTDSSLQYCLKLGDYQMVAQWIFGQDSTDLFRMLMTSLKERYSEPFLAKIGKQVSSLQDSIQRVIDQHYLADSRHILAVKR